MPNKFRKSWDKMLTNKELEKARNDSKLIHGLYTQRYGAPKKIFTKEYDKKLRTQLKGVLLQIKKDVETAYNQINYKQKTGRPAKDRMQLCKLHLIQVYFNLTNREMEAFADLFLINGYETYSYKTIERAYSDPVIAMMLHNIYVSSCGEKREVECSGDGTGQSLVISKHYRTDRLKDLRNNEETHKRKEYVYSVAIVELKTNIYVGYAAGFKSEKQLFIEALAQIKKNGFKIKSIVLDKGFSYQSIFECFDDYTKVMTLPKSNATIRGPPKWKEMLKHYIRYPFGFLKRYYKREISEANFSRDKKKHGLIKQKRKDRIITMCYSRAILHNLAMKYIYT